MKQKVSRNKFKQQSIDFIYDVCDLLMRKDIDALDRLLDQIKPYESLDLDILLTWLIATLPVKTKLKNRIHVLNYAKTVLTEEELIGL